MSTYVIVRFTRWPVFVLPLEIMILLRPRSIGRYFLVVEIFGYHVHLARMGTFYIDVVDRIGRFTQQSEGEVRTRPPQKRRRMFMRQRGSCRNAKQPAISPTRLGKTFFFLSFSLLQNCIHVYHTSGLQVGDEDRNDG